MKYKVPKRYGILYKKFDEKRENKDMKNTNTENVKPENIKKEDTQNNAEHDCICK